MRYLTQKEIDAGTSYMQKHFLKLDKCDLERYIEQVNDCDSYEDYWLENWFGSGSTVEEADLINNGEQVIEMFYRFAKREKNIRQRLINSIATTALDQRKRNRWRKQVFERDGYKCVICGNNKDLCAHHKKPASENPELKFDISNGETLCKLHHAERHPKLKELILKDRCL